jgi:hypothetical protein
MRKFQQFRQCSETGPILHGFAEAGLISLGYRTITVHDADALRTVADGD